MTTAYDSNSGGYEAGSAVPSASRLDLANPQFRFPVKATDQGPHSAAVERPALPPAPTIVLGETGAPAVLHPAHASVPAPHFQVLPVEQFVGWSVQEVAWTAPTDGRATAGPVTTPSEIPVAEPRQASGMSLRESLREPFEAEAPSEPAPVRPVELPSPLTAEAAVKHWPTSSREQVSGFAIQRTRIDQPHAIVTGAGLAAEHRRWAARNLSAELQARTVAANTSQANKVQNTSPVQPANEAAALSRQKRSDSLGGGLPLVVHPDFRWSSVVERLSATPELASQLLAAADQLLQAGQGRMLVAGAQRRQGTTTLAATISRLLIERGHRVLMVDADLARAGWTSELELTAAGSWVEQVEAFEPLQAAMAISRRSNATAVALRPVGSRKSLPPFLLDYLGQLLKPFTEQFDATVIDLGPVSQLLEELSQPARLGSALLIVQQGGADAAVELRRAKTTLNAFGISRLAVAQNFGNSKAA